MLVSKEEEKKAQSKQLEEVNASLAAATADNAAKEQLLQQQATQIAELTQALGAQQEQSQQLQEKWAVEEKQQLQLKRDVEEKETTIIEKEYQVDLSNSMCASLCACMCFARSWRYVRV